jgi:hypothetical protein
MPFSAVPLGWQRRHIPVHTRSDSRLKSELGTPLLDEEILDTLQKRTEPMTKLVLEFDRKKPEANVDQWLAASKLLSELCVIWQFPPCDWSHLRKALKDIEKRAWEVWSWHFDLINQKRGQRQQAASAPNEREKQPENTKGNRHGEAEKAEASEVFDIESMEL